MRLRAAKFADAHLTRTAAAAEPHDVTPASVEDALRRSLTIATHVTAAGSPSPRMAAAIERIAADRHPRVAKVPRTWVFPLFAGLALFAMFAILAFSIGADAIAERYRGRFTPADREVLASTAWGSVLLIIVCLLRAWHLVRRRRQRAAATADAHG